jgi:CubicO group peptidase (beta-lactamase class C family)
VEGEVVWTGAQGVADLESGAMLTPETVFDIGKVTNQLTATGRPSARGRGRAAP